MTARTASLALILLAGCASSPEPTPDAASAYTRPPSEAVATSRYATTGRPSDWALSVVGTPFVLGFRAVICTASVVVAGPTAALFAVSEDPRGGFAYLRDGLAQNCGPPYAVPLPSATDRAREPTARSLPPDVGAPRRLTPYGSAATMSP